MCGLVGMAGNLNHSYGKAFRMMLLMDQIRGFDSTGVIHVPMSPAIKYRCAKELGPPNVLMESSDIFDRKGLPAVVGRAWLGHNRAATLGAVTKDNAHPFEFGDIVGMHNGTLTHYSRLEGFATHPVDSMCLLDHISKHGIDDTWKNFRGAAALTWWDEKDQTISLVRNKERPLYIAFNKAKDVIMWASEDWMIEAACAHAKIELWDEWEDKRDPIFLLKEDSLHRYHVTALGYKVQRIADLEKATFTVPFVKPAKAITHIGGKTKFTGHTVTKTTSVSKIPSSLLGFPRGCSIIIPTKDRAQLNHGWSFGLRKSTREELGTQFRFIQPCQEDVNGKKLYFVTGREVGGEKVFRIIPETYESWCEIAEEASLSMYRDNIYKVIRRPRLFEEGEFWLSSKGVELLSGHSSIQEVTKKEDEKTYTGNNGHLVTLPEITKQFQTAGGHCCCCHANLYAIDSAEYHWLSDENIVCGECNNPTILAYLQGY